MDRALHCVAGLEKPQVRAPRGAVTIPTVSVGLEGDNPNRATLVEGAAIDLGSACATPEDQSTGRAEAPGQAL